MLVLTLGLAIPLGLVTMIGNRDIMFSDTTNSITDQLQALKAMEGVLLAELAAASAIRLLAFPVFRVVTGRW